MSTASSAGKLTKTGRCARGLAFYCPEIPIGADGSLIRFPTKSRRSTIDPFSELPELAQSCRSRGQLMTADFSQTRDVLIESK
ncbi:hypothetical protein BSY18_4152 (plasmid) [Blastomonas sp. RAC04]|nr:hypothetical protein BSY18_4152 [Blastomonas sp. RAC04]